MGLAGFRPYGRFPATIRDPATYIWQADTSHMPSAITTSGLTRSFGEVLAVDQLDLQVPAGSVYGFLGPNGSGKTTTIRMLLGLIRPDAGAVSLFDSEITIKLKSVLTRVGSMVEHPSLYGHLTGRENLEINRRLCDLPASSIDRVLGITNMADDADRPASQYSLGMKQRLGLALALLPEPDLLILDEPTNGLDPSGIREIRDLIRTLPGQTGVTVFLSSHMLSEVQQMANHVGIVNKGRLLFEGSMNQLQLANKPQILIEVSDVNRALALLQGADWRVVQLQGNQVSVALADFGQSAMIARLLVENKVDLHQLKRIELSLEELFLEMTDGSDKVSE